VDQLSLSLFQEALYLWSSTLAACALESCISRLLEAFPFMARHVLPELAEHISDVVFCGC
jgi:hypothetical protein